MLICCSQYLPPFLVGCEYDIPLATEHSIEIDSSVLGLWEHISPEGSDQNGQSVDSILSNTSSRAYVPPSKSDEELNAGIEAGRMFRTF